MERQKQIEEIAHNLCHIERDCKDCKLNGNCLAYNSATIIYNAGYLKIPEGAVVLTEDCHKALVQVYEDWRERCTGVVYEARKETAKEILSLLYTAIPKTQIVVEIKKRYGVEVE